MVNEQYSELLNMHYMNLSVLIFTKNEEKNIVDCIRSVDWADDIYVLDSISTDRTTMLAQEVGAKVIQRVFDDYSSNKDWAFKNIPFKHKFLLILDADMRVTDRLREEIAQVLDVSSDIAGFYIPIKNYFNGKWLKHGGWYPNYHLKLFRKDKVRIENRLVHEHVIINGPIGYLKNDILHLDYRGIEHFINRHNIYSSMEAVEISRMIDNRVDDISVKPNLFSRGPAKRRFVKNLAYKYLPARPLFKFIWMYILKLGFLDGVIGFHYSLLHAFYDYQISLKLKELQDKNSPLYEKYKEYLEQ